MMSELRHVGLVVHDLEAALKFWCEVMGFAVSRQMEESGSHIDAMLGLEDVRVTTAKLKDANENLLELLHFHSHPDKPQWEGKPYSTGLTHIALTVNNLSEMFNRLQSLGYSFPADPQFSPDGMVKVIYARGPEGLLIELVEMITT